MSDSENLGLTAEGLVMIGSEDMPEGTPIVRGPDFNDPSIDLAALLASYATMGFQATNVAAAIEEINKMLNWRLSDDPIKPSEDDAMKDPEVRARTKCTIWLGITSNMISSGMREIIR
jgi:deoxyhypusine synthase